MWTINCLCCTEYVTECIQRSQIKNYMWNIPTLPLASSTTTLLPLASSTITLLSNHLPCRPPNTTRCASFESQLKRTPTAPRAIQLKTPLRSRHSLKSPTQLLGRLARPQRRLTPPSATSAPWPPRAPAHLQLVIKHIKLHVSRPQTQLEAHRSHAAPDDPTKVNKHLDQQSISTINYTEASVDNIDEW